MSYCGTEKVNGREYEVSRQESQPLTKANLQYNGWDGYSYVLTGKRGAVYLAYRSMKGGELSIITGIGR